MVENPITEQEIDFFECYYSPDALIENLIPAVVDSPHSWNEDCECLTVFPYQFPFLNYSMMYADDFRLSDELNFQKKIGAGQGYNFSARNLGKSLIFIDCDIAFLPLYMPGSENMLASFDDKHLGSRADRVAQLFESHKFFELFHLTGKKQSVNRGHKFKIQSSNGTVIKGANEQVGHPTCGNAFHGIHAKTIYYEEFSYASKKGAIKRIDSVHPFGCIERFSGIPDVKIGSPQSEILTDEKKKNWIVRLPQFVREDWSESIKQEKIKEFRGEDTNDYKLNVVGDVLEGATGKFDVARIKEHCYNKEKKIKYFEIGKSDYKNFEELLAAIERLPCEACFVNADIGTTGSPTEITIIFGTDGKYKYVYNVTLLYLTTQEQAKIFKFLYHKLGGCMLSLDCTADGKSICDELVILGIPEVHLVRVSFNEKMVIGFETDENGKVKREENGKPIEKKERVIVFANQRLEHLFYNGLIEIPLDYKFLKEVSQYYEISTGSTVRFGSSTTDHLLQSLQCFGIAQFQNEFLKMNPKKRRVLGVTSR